MNLTGNPTGGSGVGGDGPHAYARRALYEWCGGGNGPLSPAEWDDFLAFQQEARGDAAAFSLVDRLLPHVTERWGADAARVAMRALRAARCAPPCAPMTDWDRAEVAIARLPVEWQGPYRTVLLRSKKAAGRPINSAGAVLSAATLRGTAYTLMAWRVWCDKAGRSFIPSAGGFEEWANHKKTSGHTPRTIGSQLRAALVGLNLVCPDAEFRGAAWVASDWSDEARLAPPPTKQAAGIVAATEVFALGRRLIAEADAQPLDNIATACAYRDGLLLMVATALPQRVRALSFLDSASTFRLLEQQLIRVDLPGRVLKRREGRKRLPGFHATLENPVLWKACDRYLRRYRPLFDDGTHLWPSSRRRGKALDPQRLSEIVAGVTEEHLGTHVPIHRLRDAVATEACEDMPEGGRIAPILLGHADPRVTSRHYDHSTGVSAARALAAALPKAARRRPSLLD